MQKTKQAPPTETQAIARGIIDDVVQIHTCGQWQDVTERLVSIQRAARGLLVDEPSTPREETLEGAIANSYRRAVEHQLEGAALLLSRLGKDELANPETIGLCLLMMNMATATLHKCMRATCAATEAMEEEWEQAVAKAEAEMGLKPRRPLDIDGQATAPMSAA